MFKTQHDIENRMNSEDEVFNCSTKYVVCLYLILNRIQIFIEPFVLKIPDDHLNSVEILFLHFKYRTIAIYYCSWLTCEPICICFSLTLVVKYVNGMHICDICFTFPLWLICVTFREVLLNYED